MPPQPAPEENYAWHLDNRNKRGMALDLKSREAKEILERLVKWADVLVINFPHLCASVSSSHMKMSRPGIPA